MPTIDIPDKICPCCGGTMWRIELRYGKHNTSNKVRYRCNFQSKQRNRKYYHSNVEECRAYNRKRYAETERTPERRQYENQKRKEYSQNLTDTQVKRMIVSSINQNSKDVKVSFDSIPQKFIDIKRKQLLLTRQLKQLQNEKES